MIVCQQALIAEQQGSKATITRAEREYYYEPRASSSSRPSNKVSTDFLIPYQQSSSCQTNKSVSISSSDDDSSSTESVEASESSNEKESTGKDDRHALMSRILPTMINKGTNSGDQHDPQKIASRKHPHGIYCNIINDGKCQPDQEGIIFPMYSVTSDATRAALHHPPPHHLPDVAKDHRSSNYGPGVIGGCAEYDHPETPDGDVTVDDEVQRRHPSPSTFSLLPPATSLDVLQESPFSRPLTTEKALFVVPGNSESSWMMQGSAVIDALDDVAKMASSSREVVASLHRRCGATENAPRLKMFEIITSANVRSGLATVRTAISDPVIEDLLVDFRTFGSSIVL